MSRENPKASSPPPLKFGVVHQWNGGWRGSGVIFPHGGGPPLIIPAEARRDPVFDGKTGQCTGFEPMPKSGTGSPPTAPSKGALVAYDGVGRKKATSVRNWAVTRQQLVTPVVAPAKVPSAASSGFGRKQEAPRGRSWATTRRLL
jgi:hypothetical protein